VLVQGGGVALHAGDERAARPRAPVRAQRLQGHRELEPLGLQRQGEPRRARVVVGEHVGGRSLARGRRRRQHGVGDGIGGERRRVLGPPRLQVERVGQGPGGDVVEAVLLALARVAAAAVALVLAELALHEAAVEPRLRLEHRLGEAPLRLREVHDVAAGRERLPRRRPAQVAVRGRRGERLAQAADLDAVAEQQAHHVRGGARVAARREDDALHPVACGLGERAATELVVILETRLPVLGGGLERRQRSHEVVGDAVAEGGDGAVVAAEVVLGAAVGLVGHAARALERRPLVPVARIEEVEHSPHEILPPVMVERRRVAAAVRLEPFRRLRGEVLVHGLRDGREEERRRRGVVVHQHLRVPAQDPVHHRPNFRLALRQEVPVHVEAEVVVAAGNAPRLVLLEGGRVVRADAHRVVPGGEPLVTVGVGGGVQHQDHVLEDLQRLGLIRGEQLVGHLHRRLEPGGLVAVHRVLEQHDRRVARRDVGGPGGRGLARVGQLGDFRADLVEPGEVRRIGDDEGPDRPALRGPAPRFDAHALGRARDQGVEVVLEQGVHRVLLPGGVAEHRLRTWHRGAIRAAGVEVESLGGEGRGDECQQ